MKFRIGIGKKIGKFYVGASHTIGGKKSRGRKSNNNGNVFGIVIAVLFFPITAAIIFGKWLYNKTQEQKAVDPDSVWYKQTYGIVLTLIFFFPVGLYLMWKYGKGWNQNIKIGVSVACGFVLIAAVLMPNSGGGNDSMTDSGLAAVASVTTTSSRNVITTTVTTSTTEPEQTTEATTTTTVEPTEEPTEAPEPTEEPERVYIVNYTSNIFHSPSCRTVKDSNNPNIKEYTGTAEELEAKGYRRCELCKPW